MKHLAPTVLAALALTIGTINAVWTWRELRRQKAAADFRWKHGRNDIALRLAARQRQEDQHRLHANGHPTGGNR